MLSDGSGEGHRKESSSDFLAFAESGDLPRIENECRNSVDGSSEEENGARYGNRDMIL